MLGLGCWPLGGQYGEVDEKTALATLEAAYEAGVNLFDTADAYGVEMGTAERLMGKVIPRFRDQIILATKVGNWGRRHGAPLPYNHPTHIYGCLDASLYRLKTDYIDLYQCHIGNLDDPDVFLEAFHKLKDEGKIRAFGISTNSRQVVETFNRDGDVTVCQLDYSLLNRTPEAELLPYCGEHDIGTLIRGPLGQGLLSGRYDADTVFSDQVRSKWNEGEGRERYRKQIEIVEKLKASLQGRSLFATALQFCLAHPAATVVIPGAKSPQQVADQVEAVAEPLPTETLDALRALTAS